jgi:hypothetical protein
MISLKLIHHQKISLNVDISLSPEDIINDEKDQVVIFGAPVIHQSTAYVKKPPDTTTEYVLRNSIKAPYILDLATYHYPDIDNNEVVFTRVINPTIQDFSKLERLFQYFNGTQDRSITYFIGT